MKIHINENYLLTSDGAHNYIIQERKLIKSSKEGVTDRYEWKDYGYYGRLETASLALLNLVPMRSSEAEAINTLMEELRQIGENVVRAVGKREEG